MRKGGKQSIYIYMPPAERTTVHACIIIYMPPAPKGLVFIGSAEQRKLNEANSKTKICPSENFPIHGNNNINKSVSRDHL